MRILIELFLGLGSWHKPDVERFLEEALPILRGGQEAIGAISDLNIADILSEQLDQPVEPVGLDPDEVTDLRHDIDMDEVYTRPFVDLWTELADTGLVEAGDIVIPEDDDSDSDVVLADLDEDESERPTGNRRLDVPDVDTGSRRLDIAVHKGRIRLEELVESDLQLAYSHASRLAMERSEERAAIRYWRRVLRGESSCALCVLASTQRYRVEELNPIHPGCDCEVEPAAKDDPSAREDKDAADRLHAAVQELLGTSDRGGRAPDYRQIMVQTIRIHGELGPLLVRPRDNFTSKSDVDRRVSGQN